MTPTSAFTENPPATAPGGDPIAAAEARAECLYDYIHRIRLQITGGQDLERWYNAVVLADSGEEKLAREILDAIAERIATKDRRDRTD